MVVCSTGSMPCSSSCLRRIIWCEYSISGEVGKGATAMTGQSQRPVTVSIIGSTGSIGTQAVDVISAEPDRFRVVALGAWSSVDLLAAQAHRLSPEVVAIGDAALAPALAAALPPGTEVVTGVEGLVAIAPLGEVVVNAAVGFAGLPVTLAALEGG